MLERIHNSTIRGLYPEQSRLARRVQKIPFHFGKPAPHDAGPGHQHQFQRLRQFILMQAEGFPQQPAGAGTNHRVTDLAAGDDPQLGLRAGNLCRPVCDEAAMNESLPRLPDACKIAALLEALRSIERQTLGGGGHGRLLYRGQALAAHAAAVGQRGLAALGRVAVQKAVLPFATDFRRLVLAFHKSVLLARVPALFRQIFAGAREDSSEKGHVNSTQTHTNPLFPR